MAKIVFNSLVLLFLAQALAYPFQGLEAPHGKSAQDRRQLPSTYSVVENTGVHAWQAPGPLDQRGPCPGLNAAANHQYIPHNGIVTVEQVSQGIITAYGISVDFAYFLATLAALQCGDGTAFSIGGPVTGGLNPGNLLGQGQGLSYSHNRFEGDASPTRGDVYEVGNGYLLQLPYFQGMLDLPVDPNDPNYTFDLLGSYSVTRFQQCVARDPYYFRGSVGGFIPPGTLAIMQRLFSNYTSDHPNGYLTRQMLLDFFSVTENNGTLQYTPGYERIPDHFSKISSGGLFSTEEFFVMTAEIFQKNPEDAAFGGNTGTTNSFTGLNINNLTGGVYNGATLLQGNNLFCFVSQQLQLFMPELISNAGVIKDAKGALSRWNTALNGALGPIVCPVINNYSEGPLQQYPGYTRTKNGGAP